MKNFLIVLTIIILWGAILAYAFTRDGIWIAVSTFSSSFLLVLAGFFRRR